MSSSYLELLESLQSRYHLPAFPDPLPSTQFHLKLESGLTVTIDFHEETQMVELFSELGTFEADKELDVLRVLVQANFFWSATAGGTLSARLDVRKAYLTYQAALSTFNGEEFVNLVEKFAKVGEQWATVLKEIAEAEVGSMPR